MKGTEFSYIGEQKDVEVRHIVFDSRKIQFGDLFVAIHGVEYDGHNYIDQALDKGARVIVFEKDPLTYQPDTVYVKVENTKYALGLFASNFYDNPSKKLRLVGVTGTNGKTSTVTMLHALFFDMGCKVGMLSTIENKIGETILPTTHTTPDAVRLNELLFEMVGQRCQYCFMEVSSHALSQGRVEGLHFEGAVFTNITHDHLDYHKTFSNYIKAKQSFFDDLTPSAFALTNIDDKNGGGMLQNTKASKKTYGLNVVTVDFKASILENTFNGLVLRIDSQEICTSLIGRFNAYNLLAVYGVSILLGIDKTEVLKGLTKISHTRGRFDIIRSENKQLIGIVDYAHTPDALKNVLDTIRHIEKGANRQIICIVGCGGNRDVAKRPIMARIATQKADRVLLTSDNPRNEDPIEIINHMREGILDRHLQKKVLSIVDRAEAIRTACMLANPRDIIVLVGKGHEGYQEIRGKRMAFNDKQVMRSVFEEQSL